MWKGTATARHPFVYPQIDASVNSIVLARMMYSQCGSNWFPLIEAHSVPFLGNRILETASRNAKRHMQKNNHEFTPSLPVKSEQLLCVATVNQLIMCYMTCEM